jgi:hypothetical protein
VKTADGVRTRPEAAWSQMAQYAYLKGVMSGIMIVYEVAAAPRLVPVS